MRKVHLIIVVMLSLLAIGCASKAKDPRVVFAGMNAATIFNQGEEALAKGKFKAAAEHFEALDVLFPYSEYSEQAHADVIYAYYEDGEEVNALAAAERFIRLYPRSKKVDYAYYMKGVINMGKQRNWLQRFLKADPVKWDLEPMRHAFTDFAQLIRYFPDSQYAADARQRMVYIRQLMARQEVEVANFYYVREAYVAAVNRASYVVQHFQGTPEVVDALALLVKSYRQLGEQVLADRSLEVLRLNFPDSAAYRELATS